MYHPIGHSRKKTPHCAMAEKKTLCGNRGLDSDRPMLKRFWRGLPWDGMGWDGEDETDPILASLRRRAAAGWRQRHVPPALRAPLWLADRITWPLAALARTQAYASAIGLPSAETRQLFRDCLLTGGNPMEVHVWRALFGGRHPLPARSVGRLLTALGTPEAHALLADKLATAEHLAASGALFPVLQRVLQRGETVSLALLDELEPDLFVKPRYGQGGRNAFALSRHGEGWHIDGQLVEMSVLRARLEKLSRQDDLLLQEWLTAAPTLADLSADGRAPVLRLTTACLPGEAPFLHTALLSIAVPGQDPRDFRKGAIHAPIDPANGRLAAGLSLAAPAERLDRLGWNGAPLASRPVPWFQEASAMALRAMAALPPVPLVHWDVIATADGPILLEGNSAGNWILASLPGAYGLDAGPLAPILARWR